MKTMNLLSLALLSFGALFPGKAYPLVFPYQNCSPSVVKRTKGITNQAEKTKADFCFECERENTQSALDSVQNMLDNLIAPKQCFLAMAIKGNRKFARTQHRICANNKVYIRKKLCINEDYIDMLKNSFTKVNQCFSSSHQEKISLLRLINQESGGILNMRSGSGAKCLGQLTTDYVNDLNKLTEKKSSSKYSETYNSAIQKCPWLKSKIINIQKLPPRKAHRKILCRTFSDPWSCLMYTVFGFKLENQKIKDNFDQKSGFMGNREFSEEDQKRFLLPTKLNEILTVKIRSKGREKTLVFWDDSELFDFYSRLPENKKKEMILSVHKTSLFEKEKEIQELFNYWSHNGGGAYAQNRMINMIHRLKQKIAAPCPKRGTREGCELRKIIESGKSLPTGKVWAFFEKDLLCHHPSEHPERKQEVACFVRRTMENSKKAFSYNPQSQDTKTMISYYKQAVNKHKPKSEPALQREDAEAFQKNVSEICPKDSFITKETGNKGMSEVCRLGKRHFAREYIRRTTKLKGRALEKRTTRFMRNRRTKDQALQIFRRGLGQKISKICSISQ